MPRLMSSYSQQIATNGNADPRSRAGRPDLSHTLASPELLVPRAWFKYLSWVSTKGHCRLSLVGTQFRCEAAVPRVQDDIGDWRPLLRCLRMSVLESSAAAARMVSSLEIPHACNRLGAWSGDSSIYCPLIYCSLCATNSTKNERPGWGMLSTAGLSAIGSEYFRLNALRKPA